MSFRGEGVRVPELLLEQLALGELREHGEGEAELLRRLRRQPGGMERLAGIWRSNETILAAYPPHVMAARILWRHRRTHHQRTHHQRTHHRRTSHRRTSHRRTHHRSIRNWYVPDLPARRLPTHDLSTRDLPAHDWPARRSRRLPARRASRRFVAALAALTTTVAAVAALLLVTLVRPAGTGEGGPASQTPSRRPASMTVFGQAVEPTQTKGPPAFRIFRKEGPRVVRLASGSSASAGDLLQITYTPGEARYGVIFSVDGRGKVTLHFPERAGQTTRLDPGGQALPYAFELDDAPGFERVFFVTGARPLDVSQILAAGRSASDEPGSRLRLPAGIEQLDLLLRKKPRSAVP